jgi:hypothetical protein
MIQIDENFDVDRLTKEEVTEHITKLEETLGKHIVLFLLVLGVLITGAILMALNYLPFNWISIVIIIMCIYDISRNLRLGRLINTQIELFKIILLFKNSSKD